MLDSDSFNRAWTSCCVGFDYLPWGLTFSLRGLFDRTNGKQLSCRGKYGGSGVLGWRLLSWEPSRDWQNEGSRAKAGDERRGEAGEDPKSGSTSRSTKQRRLRQLHSSKAKQVGAGRVVGSMYGKAQQGEQVEIGKYKYGSRC